MYLTKKTCENPHLFFSTAIRATSRPQCKLRIISTNLQKISIRLWKRLYLQTAQWTTVCSKYIHYSYSHSYYYYHNYNNHSYYYHNYNIYILL